LNQTIEKLGNMIDLTFRPWRKIPVGGHGNNLTPEVSLTMTQADTCLEMAAAAIEDIRQYVYCLQQKISRICEGAKTTGCPEGMARSDGEDPLLNLSERDTEFSAIHPEDLLPADEEKGFSFRWKGLWTTLSVQQSALLIRLMKETGILVNFEVRPLMQVLAACLHTVGWKGRKLSWQFLNNSYFTIEQVTIDSVRDLLNRMLKELWRMERKL
jgi:hypothetical protein